MLYLTYTIIYTVESLHITEYLVLKTVDCGTSIIIVEAFVFIFVIEFSCLSVRMLA